MVERDTAVKVGGAVAIVLFVLVVVGAVVVAATFEPPTVAESEYDWGDVSDDETDIRSSVVVDNPNLVGVPGVVTIDYEARLNDVTLASETERGVGFGTGTNTIELTTQMDNDRIADWWVTHINNDERSELAIEADVSAPGFSTEIPAEESTIETDILGGFQREGARTVTVRNDSFLRVEDQTAEWGSADAEETPITFSSTMENVHDYGITLVGMEYVVTMNDVELGHTQVERGIDVEPGERETLSIRVGLDTPKMADWWPEHVRDGERSNLSVAMYGIAEDDGERKRIPLRLYDERQQLTTDMLGDGDTNVSDVPEPQREETAFPEVEETQQRWGSVTDDTTEIVTTAFLTAGDNNLTEMLSLEVTQQTRINDVLVADGSASVRELEPGENPYDIVAGKDNGLVPTWWARHLNRGEESTVVTTPTSFVDAGFTKFDIELDRRQNTVETDLLADMNGQRDETVTVAGRDALRVQQVSSSWGQATPDEAPLDTTTTLRNRQPTSVTIDAVHYTVTTNGVTLADRTDQVRSVIPAGSTEDVDVQMRLDNSKMDEWWVRHVPEERSTFQVDVEVTVTAGGRTDTVELESLGQSSTVETDMLNQDEE